LTKKRQSHTLFYEAQFEKNWLKEKLNGDNPILYIHPQANSWTSFSNIVCEPYVRKIDVPYEVELIYVDGWHQVSGNATAIRKPTKQPGKYLKI